MAVGEVEVDLVRVEVAERIHHVFGIEGDGDFRTSILDRDCLARLANLGRLGDDRQDVVGEGQRSGVRLVRGDDGDATESGKEFLARNDHALVEVGRDDLAVVRVGAVDELGAEHGVAKLEDRLGLLGKDAEISLVAQDMHELGHALGGQDDVALRLGRELDFMLDERKAAAIRGDSGQLAVAEGQKHAGEDAAGLVGGDGIGGLAEHLEEDAAVDAEEDGAVRAGDRREVTTGEAHNLEEGRAALHGGGVGIVDRDLYCGFRKLADDTDEAADRKRRGPGLLDDGLDLAADANIKVRRGERQASVLRDEQGVGEDLERAACGHDVLHLLERL